VFSLTKIGDVWTLHCELGELYRVLLVGAFFAIFGYLVIEHFDTIRPIGIAAAAAICFGLLAWLLASNAATTATFDLKRRRVEVRSKRPWFGRPRAFDFADVAALDAVRSTDDMGDFWEIHLELRNGTRLLLGSEPTRQQRVQQYLAEIRSATGIPGR
jgi:hypothetical protein